MSTYQVWKSIYQKSIEYPIEFPGNSRSLLEYKIERIARSEPSVTTWLDLVNQYYRERSIIVNNEGAVLMSQLLQWTEKRIPAFDLDANLRLMEAKRIDYGKKPISLTGETGILVRILDKLCRIENIQDHGIPMNESLRDSFVDTFNYVLIWFEYVRFEF